MIINSIQGGGGIRLHVREWGKADAPAILFIHGWSQNHLCWHKQYESELADAFHLVAFDLRGHGMSEAPEAQECYTEPQPCPTSRCKFELARIALTSQPPS